MSSQTKLTSLINELGKLTLYSPNIVSIDPLSSPDQGFPKHFRLIYSQNNYRESTPFKNSIYLAFDPSKSPAITEFPAFSSVENDVMADSYSPSRDLRALMRKSSDKTVLEIWGKSGFWKSLRVSDFHEAIYADPMFCLTPMAWSQNEKRIVYVAEKKEEKPGRYFDGLDTDEQATKTFEKFLYKQDLGEGYRGKKMPLVFVYDIEEGELYQVMNIPKDVTPTLVSFGDAEGNSIIFCGITFKDGIKLGLKFCSNRPSQIYHAKKLILEKANKKKKAETKPGEKPEEKPTEEQEKEKKKAKEAEIEQNLAIKLNKDDISSCPILNKDKTKIIYLFSRWTYIHSMGVGIKLLRLNNSGESVKEGELILDVVSERRKSGEFPGITGFQDIFVKTGWLGERHIVFNTYSGCSLGLYILDIETKEIKRIDQGKYKSEEWRLRGVYDDIIVTSISNVDGGNRIAMYYGANLKEKSLADITKDAKWYEYQLNFQGFDGAILNKVETKTDIDERIIEVDGIEHLFFGLKEADSTEGAVPSNNKRPLLVLLHGGPHAVYTGVYSVFRHYLIRNGFNLLLPCFTGSMGYGEKFLEDLAGRIGQIDVDEIVSGVRHCIKEGLCDESNVSIFGGSYGGFLCGVLLAKFSEMFKTAIILNPAVNVNHLWETSDIPEWGPGEALRKDTVFDISSEEVKRMYDMSPVSMYKGKEIKSSILLLLGEKDKRVPYGGALQYYNILKSKGADIKMLSYPESDHSLAGNPEVEFDVLIQNIIFWNEKHGK